MTGHSRGHKGAQQKARYGEANISGVFALPETLLFGKLRAFEMVPQILQVGNPLKLLPKKLGPAAAIKGAWAMPATLDAYCISFTSGALGERK